MIDELFKNTVSGDEMSLTREKRASFYSHVGALITLGLMTWESLLEMSASIQPRPVSL